MPETYGELKTLCCKLRNELAAAKAEIERARAERDAAKKALELVTAERDAAVADMKEYGIRYGFTCEVCAHMCGTMGNPCHYPADVDVSAEMCEACDSGCPCGHCDGVSQWSWRGMREGAS